MLSQRQDNNAPELRRVVPDLFDRRPVGLVVKAAIVAAGMLVGATAGFFLHEVGPIIGAISGMVSALFVLAILARGVPWFRSTSHEQHMSLDKYRRIRRRFFRLGLLTYVWLLVGFVLGQVHLLVRGSPTIWFIIAWIVPTLTWGSLLMHNHACLDKWRCPDCGHRFPTLGVFARYPHVCRNCGFSIDRQGYQHGQQ